MIFALFLRRMLSSLQRTKYRYDKLARLNPEQHRALTEKEPQYMASCQDSKLISNMGELLNRLGNQENPSGLQIFRGNVEI